LDFNLETARAKITVSYLAENLPLSEAEKFYDKLSETCRYLERRIARERNVPLRTKAVVLSAVEAKAS